MQYNDERRGICVYEVRTNLLILVGTFSEDMITTGISFSLDDSCMHESHSVGISSIILLASCYQARVKGKERERKKWCAYLDLLEELVSSHLGHPVVGNDHAHVGLLKQIKRHTHYITHCGERSREERTEQKNGETYGAQQLQCPLPAVHGRHCKCMHAERAKGSGHDSRQSTANATAQRRRYDFSPRNCELLRMPAMTARSTELSSTARTCGAGALPSPPRHLRLAIDCRSLAS